MGIGRDGPGGLPRVRGGATRKPDVNKQQLASRIWASANKLRSKIEAHEYKDYILGLIFYTFL